MRNILLSLCFIAATFGSFNSLAQENNAPFKVAILMFDEVQIIDFAAPYEVFGQAKFEVFTVSPTGKSITTAMGLKVTPDHSFNSLPEVDAILVPGGDVSIISKNTQVQNWLKSQHSQVGNILSVCTGSDIVAEAGLLNGLSATTFHKHLKHFATKFPKIDVLDDQRYVDNGKIITSAGLSSGIDAALYLVSKIKGIESAKTIAMHIEYDWQQENAFIRGTMADKYYPNNQYQWHEGTQFSNPISYGSKTSWYRSYEIVTSSNSQQLMDIYTNAMSANSDWKLKESSENDTLIWQKTINNNDWQLSFKVEKNAQGEISKLINTLSILSSLNKVDLAQAK